MGLSVSKTPSEKACEGRDAAEVAVVKSTIGGDGVSPHQIPHTEIVEGLVEREVGTGALKDMLRGGIWGPAVSNVSPRTGGSPPDMGIGVDNTLVRRRSTIIRPRDTRVVALVVASIGFGGVLGHWLVSDEGGDGIVPSTTIPYITYPLARDVSIIRQRNPRPTDFGLGTLVRS